MTIDVRKGLAISIFYVILIVIIITAAVIFLFMVMTPHLERMAYDISANITP